MNILTTEQQECLERYLKALHDSCSEALDGTWDRSDDGFESMQTLIERVQKILGLTEGGV